MLGDIKLVNDDIDFVGDITCISDEESLVQSAIENIRIVYGEIPINDERGNMIYSRRLKLFGTDMRRVEDDCRNAILYDNRIKDVLAMKATRDTMFMCSISFTLVAYDGILASGGIGIRLM